MSIPKYDELFEYVLNFLADGLDHPSTEMRDAIVSSLGLSEQERNTYLPSKRQRVIDNRIGWARTYLKKAGLMSSPKRGWYRIEKRGIEALRAGVPITNEYLAKYESFRVFKNHEGSDSGLNNNSNNAEVDYDKPAATPDEALGQAYEEITLRLVDDVIDEVLKLSPTAFERMVLDLMAKMGYGSFESSSATTPITGDEGIDGIIMLDKLGFDLIYVQAKRYAADHPVGRPDIQRFVGAISGRGGKGLFVTTSKFSQQAIDYAALQHIVLVDGRKLARLMIENDFGVAVKQIYAIKAVDTDLFCTYEDEA